MHVQIEKCVYWRHPTGSWTCTRCQSWQSGLSEKWSARCLIWFQEETSEIKWIYRDWWGVGWSVVVGWRYGVERGRICRLVHSTLAEILRTIISRKLAVMSLSVIIGDCYSHTRHVYDCPNQTSRPHWAQCINLWLAPTRDYVGAKKQLQWWMVFLLNHLPVSSRASMAIKHVTRREAR